MNGYFSNTGRLAKFILRRERITSTIWLICLITITAIVPVALSNIFDTELDRQIMAETIKNPAMIAMMGPVYDTENYTVGAMNANEMLLFTLIAVSIMSIMSVARHTRGDEERGRLEVIRSLPVGRLSNLGATMLFSTGVNLLLALLAGLCLFVTGVDGLDFNSSMLYGACMGVIGLFFASMTALFSQLCATSRSTVGCSFMFLGLFYIIRAAGDIGNETLSRISPLGLILRTEVCVRSLWWPVPVILLLTAAVTVLAFYLNSIRDMDRGFLPAKPGRKTASFMLRSPFGLNLRLQRNTLIAWIIGMFIIGATYGSIMGDLEGFLSSNDFFKTMVASVPGYSMTEMFISMIFVIMSMLSCAPVIGSILKLRNEEKRGYTEHILARVVSRSRYLAGYVLIAVKGSFVVLFAGVLGLWSASSMVMEDPFAFSSMFKTAMVYLPALWIMIGITVFLTGILPDLAAGISWAVLGFSFFSLYIGRIMQLPDWVGKLSPFGHIPELPAEEINYVTLAVLTIIAIALTSAGFIFYSRRDTK